MSTEEYNRKFTAVQTAHVVGYSRLMRDDEVGNHPHADHIPKGNDPFYTKV